MIILSISTFYRYDLSHHYLRASKEMSRIIKMHFIRGLSREISGINCQADGFEVPVKRKTGDIIKHMGYYNKRNGITKGYLFVSGEFLENICNGGAAR